MKTNIVYDSSKKKSEAIANVYRKTLNSPYRYLAYRDIPNLIKKYVSGKTVLDYGCGTGISTQFLINQGFAVTAIDISEEMLKQARDYCPLAEYYHVQDSSFSEISKTYDLIFSSFVLCELGKEISEYLNEARKLLGKEGVFIAITSSEHMYSKHWFCFDNQYEQNQNLKSGDKGKILASDTGIEFTDYYWTKQDYLNFFQQAGFDPIEVYYPLGKSNEPFSWKDETVYSPFLILISKLKELALPGKM